MAKQPRGKRETSPSRSFVFALGPQERNSPLHQAANATCGRSLPGPFPLSAPPTTGRSRTLQAAASSRSSSSAAAGPRTTSRSSSPAPSCGANIVDVSVDGTTNSQCNPRNDADDEVALDIQVAGAAYAVAQARRRISASTGRRTLPRPLPRPLPTAATSARSPGARTRPAGARPQATQWSRRRPLRRQPGWSFSPRRATTTRATAGQAARMSTCRPQRRTLSGAAGRQKPQTGEETVWNNDPGKPPERAPGAATRRSFRCPRGRPARLTAPAAWSRTWRRTPIRTPATRSFSTAPPQSSAAQAPSRRFTPGCSRRSERNSASSRRNCT